MAPASAPESRVSGELYAVQAVKLPTATTVQGTLYPDEVAVVSARVPGRIVEVNCDLGDELQQGDNILRIEDSEYQLRVIQAEAQLAQARASVGLRAQDSVASLDPLKAPPVREARAIWDEAKQSVSRLNTLFKQGTVVANDYELAQSAERVADAQYSSAINGVREKIALIDVQTAQLDLAKQQLADTQVDAPMHGQVQRRMVAVGTYIQAGQPVVEIARTEVLRYRASVPERYAQQIAVGLPVKLRVDDTQLDVEITRISPTLDYASRSLVFEAEVPNPESQLRSGLFATGQLILDDAAMAIAIPKSALVRFAGVDKVWKVIDGKVAEAVVEIGREQPDQIEIVQGLSAGDTILLDGSKGRPGKYIEASTDVASESKLNHEL
ncbi:MAG: efflux RND transporter periplasmic adaptor subunit [Pirellulaceae bacterium]